jgi:hypothetical protein
MKSNFTGRYTKRFRNLESWTTHEGYNKYSKRKSCSAKKILHRWYKNLHRKAENIIAPVTIDDI